MKTLCIALLVSFMSLNAFAIDQITLVSGEVVTGKILADVPNRHVDIELVNGTKKRFQKNEVANVERDVPSSQDKEMIGNDTRMYVGVTGGLAIWNSSPIDSKSQFDYGFRFGANMGQLGTFSKFAAGMAIDHFSVSSDANIPNSVSVTHIAVQFLFRKISNTGFYFGPEVGLGLSSANGISATGLVMGGTAGYEYFVTDKFSMGPELHFDSLGSNSVSQSSTTLKVLYSASLHFE